MALDPTLPTQYGVNQLNMWAMLRALVFNNVGILPFAGTPVNGTSGTYAGFAGPGTLVIDNTTGSLYINVGTQASPIWNGMNGAVAGLGGLGNMATAKFTYDFAVDGGAQATITPANSPTIPINAIIIGGVIDVTTILGSGGAATVGLGLGSGAQVASLLAPTAFNGAPWSTTGIKALIPVFTAATAVKVAASTRLTLTIAAANLNAGKFDVSISYYMGNA